MNDAGVVQVEPVTLGWATALARGDADFTREFGVRVEPGWAGFPEVIPMMVRHASQERPAMWGPHLVFDVDGSLVGNGGWKGPPVDGVAELGYAVAPARRNRGIAAAVVNRLLAAAREAGLTTAIAHTLTTESASTRVLTKCGFQHCGTTHDPEDGPVWRWERHL